MDFHDPMSIWQLHIFRLVSFVLFSWNRKKSVIFIICDFYCLDFSVVVELLLNLSVHHYWFDRNVSRFLLKISDFVIEATREECQCMTVCNCCWGCITNVTQFLFRIWYFFERQTVRFIQSTAYIVIKQVYKNC